MAASSTEPTHDVVVFGATSFVGQILCRYLADRHGFAGDGPEGLTWAIAGRNRAKLDALVADLGDGAKLLDVLVVDAHDAAGVRAMAESARVVVSTVGPYALHGSPLVEACAATGTDYCDLTGEVQWVRRMVDAHQLEAERSGARLVTSAGYDSIPSDLGVHVLQKAAVERFGVPCERVRMGVKAMKGGVSGGTLASLVNAVREAREHPEVRKQVANPYSLCPPDARKGPRQPNVVKPEHDEVFDRWVGPFVMAAINTRVVHRSNALLGHAYGKDFVYDEVMITGDGPVGAVTSGALTAGLGAFVGAVALPGVGRLVEKALPEPGEGPSPEAQEAGFFVHELWGRTPGGEVITGRVGGDRDPGYGSTAKMLGEVATSLAKDLPGFRDAPAGGFWTPASLLGDVLVDRLVEHAGLTFEVR